MFGINSLWLVLPLLLVLNAPNIGALTAVAAFGALLQDLDAADSKVKHLSFGGVKPFAIPAKVAYRAGHRGMLHSLLGWGLASVVMLPVGLYLGWPGWGGLMLGYGSHLLADSCTRTGIPLLYPRRMRYFALPCTVRIVTGSAGEEGLFSILAAGAITLMLTHLFIYE